MKNNDPAAKVQARAAQHGDRDIRAAAYLACHSILLPKIAAFIESDGWIDWPAVATYLIEGAPWSGGERRLAKLGCSLSGRLRYVEDQVRADADIAAWSIEECLSGLDQVNLAAALGAIHIAATGHVADGGGQR